MDPVQELGNTLHEIATLKAQVAELEEHARILLKEVGAELGMRVTNVGAGVSSATPPRKGKPGRQPRHGKTDYQRCVEAVAALKQARLEDIVGYLNKAGTPISKNSLRSYLTRAAAKNELFRVDGEPGMYTAVQMQGALGLGDKES